MTNYTDLIAELRNSSGVATADVNARVALFDRAADAIEALMGEPEWERDGRSYQHAQPSEPDPS